VASIQLYHFPALDRGGIIGREVRTVLFGRGPGDGRILAQRWVFVIWGPQQLRRNSAVWRWLRFSEVAVKVRVMDFGLMDGGRIMNKVM
jgi:hypothetical protein